MSDTTSPTSSGPGGSRHIRRQNARPGDRVRIRQRRTLSCLPCRLHKLRCDRAVPCQTCCRHQREDQCRLNPAPASLVAPVPSKGGPIGARNAFLSNLLSSRTWNANSGSLALYPPAVVSHEENSWLPRTGGNTIGTDKLSGQGAEPAVELHGSESSENPVSSSESVASLAMCGLHSQGKSTLLDEPQVFWKRYLVGVLPTQNQSDLLVSFFFENFNWIYQTIHAPSFRSQYGQFWTQDVADVDLVWLALLFMILCLSSLHIPSELAEVSGFEVSELALLSKRWYSASRQALHAGGYDSKPTLTQIQVFLISQLYWYGMKNVEALNSHLGTAVRNAQSLGLDKECPPSVTDCLEREMRHRIWWDLVCSDTFQSLCLARPPLVQSYLSSVPFPSNCNDVDITPTSIKIRPLSEPTEMSMHHFRARIFKVLNRLYANNGAGLSSYAFISTIDAEITTITDQFPWYFQIHQEEERPPSTTPALSPRPVTPNLTSIHWTHHLLHSCISVQRVRMYRPFLHHPSGDPWRRCVAAATSALAVYRRLRSRDVARFRRSQRAHVQAYQTFSTAVVLATFLLVERPPDDDACVRAIREDVDMAVADLRPFASARGAGDARCLPMVADGVRALNRILALYDARRSRGDSSNSNSSSSSGARSGGDAPTALVPAIFSVFGGEASARKYLERCTIEYIINEEPGGGGGGGGGSADAAVAAAVASLDGFMWDALLDPSVWGDPGDGVCWADMDFGVEKVS